MTKQEEVTPPGEPKFTRGPWEYRNGYVVHRNATDLAGRSRPYTICGVSSPGANEMRAATGGYGTYEQAQEIQDANGHLLAAAPTLYEALRNLVNCKWVSGTVNKRVDEARAALALVDGPQETK